MIEKRKIMPTPYRPTTTNDNGFTQGGGNLNPFTNPSMGGGPYQQGTIPVHFMGTTGGGGGGGGGNGSLQQFIMDLNQRNNAASGYNTPGGLPGGFAPPQSQGGFPGGQPPSFNPGDTGNQLGGGAGNPFGTPLGTGPYPPFTTVPVQPQPSTGGFPGGQQLPFHQWMGGGMNRPPMPGWAGYLQMLNQSRLTPRWGPIPGIRGWA